MVIKDLIVLLVPKGIPVRTISVVIVPAVTEWKTNFFSPSTIHLSLVQVGVTRKATVQEEPPKPQLSGFLVLALRPGVSRLGWDSVVYLVHLRPWVASLALQKQMK